MENKELKKVLEAHKHFIAQDCEEWKEMRADLRNADLRGADLRGADLRGAYLSGAYLGSADLRRADLRGADLRGAYLRRDDLNGADLRGANLNGANLGSADLRNADLSDTELWRADLSSADLNGADLSGAYLNGANLSGADLRNANLSGAKYNERTAFLAFVCPEEGDFIAWKKVGDAIVKLRIPSEAKRSSATTRKCRCEFAEVLALQNLDGTPYNDDKVVNNNYVKTIYKVGEIVSPDSWDNDRWNECSHGIHFFMTKDEAVRY